MKLKRAVFFIVFICLSIAAKAQRNTVGSRPTFNLKGVVQYKGSLVPIKNVHVYIVGGRSTYTLMDGSFLIKASADDELVFEHQDIETVYYTIKDDEDIKLLVEDDFIRKRADDKMEEEASSPRLKNKKMESPRKSSSVAFRYLYVLGTV